VVVTPSGICDSTEAGKVIVTASSEGKPAEHQVVAQTTVGSAVVTTAPSSSALVVSQSVYASPASNGSPTPSAVPVDANWLFICDWRNCPRKKFKSLNELKYHVCNVHCPDHAKAESPGSDATAASPGGYHSVRHKCHTAYQGDLDSY